MEPSRTTYPERVDGWHWVGAALEAVLLLPLWIGGILIAIPLIVILVMAMAS